MKKCLAVGIAVLLSLVLAGCVIHRPAADYTDFTRETWMRHIETNPAKWMHAADEWFLNGGVTETEDYNHQAPVIAAMSQLRVKVSNFTDIKVNGAFRVQIEGTNAAHNGLYIQGTNAAIRSIGVVVRNHSLFLYQSKGAPDSVRYAVVKIRVRHLASLTQMGCGSIEAINIHTRSFRMTETAGASGLVLIGGHLNVKQVANAGDGVISIFGVDSSRTGIYSTGHGSINLCGNISIKTIYHTGGGDVNLIGANNRHVLQIYADGSGKIGIKGPVCLSKIEASGKVRVYIDKVMSHAIKVMLSKEACVGLMGCADSLSLELSGKTRFFGRYLCTRDTYVKAYDESHANVTASRKFFANASGVSTIYYFGPRAIMNAFTSSYGKVLYIMNTDFKMCFPAGPRYSYKGEI